MSAVLETEVKTDAGARPAAVEIREGDWKAYVQSVSRYKDDKRLAERYGNLIEYKRACALAYLGRRAQMHGGVCSTRHPHIITQQFIVDLEVSNRLQRHARYPWLKALMTLLGEIEQIQDQISTNNVLTLVPAAK